MAEAAEDRRTADAKRKRAEYRAKKAAAQAERPPLKEASTCAEFARANLTLPAQSSFRTGRFIPWKNQVAWLNLGAGDVENGPRSITVQKCARAGYTKCLVAIAAYNALRGKNSLLVQPRHKDAISFRDDALAPVLEDCYGAEAHAGLPWTKTELHLRPRAYAPAQAIKLLFGNSPELRRVMGNFCGVDEIDALDLEPQNEGSIIERLQSRLREARGILMVGSTPSVRSSMVDVCLTDAHTVFTWSFRCPTCETWQPFDFEKLTDEGLGCAECGEILSEATIRKAACRWQAEDLYIGEDGMTLTDGEKDHAWPRSIGFKINALGIEVLQWDDLLEADRRAQNNPSARKVVRNEILGLPWSQSLRDLSVGTLMDARTHLESAPERVRVSGADVQRDRIETILTEWDAEERAYVLDYAVVYGDTDQPGKGAWLGLAAKMNEWKPHGGLVDSGYHGDGAYAFARTRYGWRPFKGLANPLTEGGLYRISRQRDKGNADLVVGDVSQAKTILADRLGDDKATWFRFNKTLEEPFFHGLLSEELRIEGGKTRWVKLQDNEPWDCLVMAFLSQRFMRQRLHWRPGETFPHSVPRRGVLRTIG